MADWTLILDDHQGNELAELEVAPTMRWELGTDGQAGGAKVTFALDHYAGAAYKLMAALANGIPQLRAYRTDPEGVPRLRFRGHWWPQRDEYTDGASEAQCTFRSPLAKLETRLLVRSGTIYARVDAATAVLNCIGNYVGSAFWPLGAHHHTGLAEGNATPVGVLADQVRIRGRAEIEDLQEVLAEVAGQVECLERFVYPAFESDLQRYAPNTPVLAYLDAGPPFGVDRTSTVRMEVGEGTIANSLSASREIQLPVNYVQVYDPSGVEVPVDVSDQASTERWGYYVAFAALEPGVSAAAMLSHAEGLLRPDLRSKVSISPDPTSAPQPWDEWWLGDTIGYLLDSGAFQDAGTARVSAFEATLDDSGNEESWKVEWGEQLASWPGGVIKDLRRRLAALER